ncbi:uncharacterized protein LOC144168912 [Haemaphysalis longicornis]
MFAVVRFTRDLGRLRLHVLPISDVKNLDPAHLKDFSTKVLYSALWTDPTGLDTGNYSAQVLLLTETREEAERRVAGGGERIVIPKIPELHDNPDATCSEDEVVTEKEARKVQKENRQAAKKLQYQEILKRNLANATRKHTQCQSQPLKQPSKKRRTPSSSTSGSESDSLCSRRELEQAIKDKEKWKKRARQFEAEKAALTKQVTTLQECLRSEIFRLEKQAEAGKGVPGIARSQPTEPIREDAFQCLSPSPSIEMEDPFQQGQDVYMPKQTQEGASTAEAQDVQVPRPAEQEGAAVSTLQRREGELPSHSSAVPCPAQDFSYLANGSRLWSTGQDLRSGQMKESSRSSLRRSRRFETSKRF